MAGSLNRVKQVVDKVKHIQEESANKADGSAKYITDRCNTIAKGENERLNVIVDKKTGELTSEPVCSYRYYTQLMENYRNGIKALGYKHHAIEKHLGAFVRKYSSKKQGLGEMLDSSLDIKQLRENIILLRADTVTGSEFRSDLLKLKIEHHAYYMFEPKGVIKDWIKDDDKKKLNKKLHEQILVNPDWVKKLATELLTKKKPEITDLAVGIALATGRRLTEVMKTASFTIVDKMTLKFSGQLKTKNRHLFEEIGGYDIPTLIEAKIVATALNKLRKMTGKDLLRYNNVLGDYIEMSVKDGDTKDYYHNRAVHKKYESTVNRAVRALLMNGNFSLKSCRALYTEITYEEHANDGETRSAYRHRVLGHSLIETQLHYDSFKVDKSVETIKLVEEKPKANDAENQKHFLEYLIKADSVVASYARAPKIKLMHDWLKSEVEKGLKFDVITASYIRRFCLIDGKQLNLNTIKKYLEEFVKLSDYQAPAEKKEPESKLEKEIMALEEQIEEMQTRLEDIAEEQEELDDEVEQLRERLAEIEDEGEELELEQESINSELEEQLEHLAELKQQQEDELNAGTDEKVTWPEVTSIDIKTKKVGKFWQASATVNGKVFEVETAGRKTQTIEALKKYYQEQINKM